MLLYFLDFSHEIFVVFCRDYRSIVLCHCWIKQPVDVDLIWLIDGDVEFDCIPTGFLHGGSISCGCIVVSVPYFVRVLSKYFLLSSVNVNDIVFLISSSIYSLLVYKCD